MTPRERELHPHLLHEVRPAYPRVSFAGVFIASVTFFIGVIGETQEQQQ